MKDESRNADCGNRNPKSEIIMRKDKRKGRRQRGKGKVINLFLHFTL